MDHPWRFPASAAAAAAADLCPICSTRHFPFCPPPPPPPYPFPYDLHPPPPPPPQFHPPSPMLGPIRPHGYEFPDWEAPHKRMRVGEAPPFDPYTAAQPPPPSRASAEGERLLGLIREHGRPPPPQWHGEPHQPDGFGYGGGRSNLAPNYYNHYVQGGNFTNYDDAGRLPPPPPPQESYHPVAPGFDHSYNHALEGGPHEKYLNRDRYHRQFNLSEASPGARPHLLRPPYAEAGNHLDDCGWHPEVGAVPPPPEPLMPSGNAIASPSDYCAMPPPRPASSSLFPVLSSAAPTAMLPPGAYTLHQGHPLPKANCYNGPVQNEGSGFIYRPHLHNDSRDGRPTHAVEHSLNNAKTNIINACHLFKQPLRASRPDHIVIILRGLPGSGKSYLAKALRDLEVENGGNAPRIHSMDDYFMIEVEKNVEDNGGSKSSSASKRRKQLTKKVIEYCYEPEMEETYRSSMLTAFKKTLDEGNFTFVIVDDRNLRVADFAQFWATAKKSGYEVYLLEAPYKDPTGCAARNVHGFSLHDIQMMAQEWEEAPPLYLRLDIHSLFHNDNLRENSIEEVDMDMEDVDDANDITVSTSVENLRAIPESLCSEPDQGFSKPGERWDSEEEEDLQGFKELGQSKWSKDFDENTEKSEHAEGSTHALSALVQTYGTRRKSVSWGDRLERGGFSIGAAKRRLTSSLIIGPGSGYNLACNPLAEDNSSGTKGKINNETKRRFGEQLRAESESFKAVFDRRRQRIGGFNNGDDE